MDTRKFKIVVVVAFMIRALWLILAFALKTSLPPDLLRQKAEMVQAWHSPFPGWVSILNMFLPFFALMGLYYFRRFSREAFGALIVVGYFMSLTLGPFIEPRIVGIFGSLNTLLTGVILALIFCEPIAERFRV